MFFLLFLVGFVVLFWCLIYVMRWYSGVASDTAPAVVSQVERSAIRWHQVAYQMALPVERVPSRPEDLSKTLVKTGNIS